jgi:ABC-2 type transport system ATP-binding protein
MRPIIRGLRDAGTTVFLNSHLLSEVEQVCDRVAIVHRGRVVALGTLDELLAEAVVRVRVAGLADPAAILRSFGEVAPDGDWLVIRGIGPGQVPDLVAALVRAGGRIHAVEPARESLEARFAALVGGEARPAPAGAAAEGPPRA